MKALLAIFVSLALTACATTPPPHLSGSYLQPDQGVFQQLGKGKYYKGLAVGTVSSSVDAIAIPMTDRVHLLNQETFKEALQMAISRSGLYGGTGSNYVVSAELQELDLPFLGFNLTVTSTAKYTIKDKRNGKVSYSDTLSLPCTVRFAEAFNGQERMQKAIICSLRENVAHFLRTITH